MQTHEKIATTILGHVYCAVSDCYDFDAKHSELISTTPDSETYEFGPYQRTYWFDSNDSITHTQLQFDENWVEPEGAE